MNNEPAAWLHIQGDYSEACTRPLDDDEIERGWEQKPLYTHPAKTDRAELDTRSYMLGYADGKEATAKTLTDEEILQEAENMFGTYFFESIDDPYWIEFARAILRKAGEK